MVTVEKWIPLFGDDILVVNKDDNIGKYGYISNWILRRKIWVDISEKRKLYKIYKNT